MKTLTLALFAPVTQSLTLYWQEGGYSRTSTVPVAELPGEQQEVVAAAMAWAQSQLPAGMDELVSVHLRREMVATAWDEAGEATAWGPQFTASLTGRGALGEATTPISLASGPIAAALQGMWQAIETAP